MPINEPLLRDAVAHIELDERAFDMGDWIRVRPECGTTMCLAGHVLVASGMTVDDVARINGRMTGAVGEVAGRLLGMREDDSGELFSYTTVYERTCDCDDCVALPEDDRAPMGRPVKLPDLKEKITELTGIEFKKDDA